MPKFPTKEADILALVTQMIAGKQAHPTDFPHLTGPTLTVHRNNYIAARDAQTNAYAAAQLATKEKLAALKSLEEVMKNKLKQTEVDVAGDPEKLGYLGWGPKVVPQPADSPGQPNNLRSINQGRVSVTLEWDSPTCGGTVRNYIIQRRCQQTTDGEFGPWKLIATALQNRITLTNQPQKSTLEYRVKAVNTSGESMPSNVIAVVL
jgi:hypothetical protein